MDKKVKKASRVVSDVSHLLGSSSVASATSGEMIFSHTVSFGDQTLSSSLTPFKYLLSGIVRLFKGLKEVFKDKKKLVPSIVIAVIWIALIVLPMIKVDSSWVKYINFLTFAQGGIEAGTAGVIGGIIGKGIFSYFIFSLVIPIFSGAKPFAGVGRGFKTLLSTMAVKNSKAFIPQLVGIGIALIFYNFLTGSASLENSMVGIAAFLLSIKALTTKAGFLRGFLISIAQKFKKGKLKDTTFINRMTAGWTVGFAIAVALSSSNIGFICYVIGIAVIVVGIILNIIMKNTVKEEA